MNKKNYFNQKIIARFQLNLICWFQLNSYEQVHIDTELRMCVSNALWWIAFQSHLPGEIVILKLVTLTSVYQQLETK